MTLNILISYIGFIGTCLLIFIHSLTCLYLSGPVIFNSTVNDFPNYIRYLYYLSVVPVKFIGNLGLRFYSLEYTTEMSLRYFLRVTSLKTIFYLAFLTTMFEFNYEYFVLVLVVYSLYKLFSKSIINTHTKN